MKDLDVQYSFNKSEASRMGLKGLRKMWIILPIFIVGMFAIFLPLLIYFATSLKVIYLEITLNLMLLYAVIFGSIFTIYVNKNLNHMIHKYNVLYTHNVQIRNNHVKLTLTSKTVQSMEIHEFDILKIKKIKDTYIIYQDAHHYFYLPAKYVD